MKDGTDIRVVLRCTVDHPMDVSFEDFGELVRMYRSGDMSDVTEWFDNAETIYQDGDLYYGPDGNETKVEIKNTDK